MDDIYYKGNQDLIDEQVIALFCSRSIPLSIYYPLLDFLKILFDQTITLAGGWHSTIEKKAIVLRQPLSSSNIIYYLAKGIHHFQVPDNLQADLNTGKLLIVSQWEDDKRIDKRKTQMRNSLMLQTYQRFLFLSIVQGGVLEKLYHKCLEKDKNIYLFNHFSNASWKNDKINLIDKDDLGSLV